MSLTPTTPRVFRTGAFPGRSGPQPATERRVRHQARDAVVLMAFSACASTAIAAGLLLVAQLGR